MTPLFNHVGTHAWHLFNFAATLSLTFWIFTDFYLDPYPHVGTAARATGADAAHIRFPPSPPTVERIQQIHVKSIT